MFWVSPHDFSFPSFAFLSARLTYVDKNMYVLSTLAVRPLEMQDALGSVYISPFSSSREVTRFRALCENFDSMKDHPKRCFEAKETAFPSKPPSSNGLLNSVKALDRHSRITCMCPIKSRIYDRFQWEVNIITVQSSAET